jgi:apolipoprotein N-acyltransferase
MTARKLDKDLITGWAGVVVALLFAAAGTFRILTDNVGLGLLLLVVALAVLAPIYVMADRKNRSS